jgi:hypothetical protein
MLLGKSFRQESIANWAGKGYINHAACVHVPDLRTSETKFSAAKAVRVNRYLRLRGKKTNFLFQPLQMLHIPRTPQTPCSLPENGPAIQLPRTARTVNRAQLLLARFLKG